MQFRVMAMLLAMTLAPACSQSVAPPVETSTPEAPPVPIVQLDPAKGAILPVSKTERLARQCSRKSPGPVTGTWSPTRTMIADLEFTLGEELEQKLKAIPEAGAKPQDYYRQYAGLLIDGRQVIYINGVHNSVIDRDLAREQGAGRPQRGLWSNEPVMICDGGTLTFGVEYDPATKAFDRFAFNGRL
jgi:hypothetical protein